MKEIDEIITMAQSAKDEAEKALSKGNKSAGVRLRKIMQDIKVKAQSVRIASQAVGKS